MAYDGKTVQNNYHILKKRNTTSQMGLGEYELVRSGVIARNRLFSCRDKNEVNASQHKQNRLGCIARGEIHSVN